ncbi:MAG TPA: hypothetical protein VL284_03005 [Thermoanaerobaculia bacterium]|nr:hypothetical protein [Thermoanaerobaculia bacterium]
MPEDAGFREVFRGDFSSVELAAALLQEQGVDCHVRYEQAGGTQVTGREAPLMPGRSVVLMVPSIAYDEARDYLARFDEPEPDYITELSSDVRANETKRRGVAAFILVILFAPLAIAIVSLLIVLIGALFK